MTAVCDHGGCAVACGAISCPLDCPSGFAVDATGCLVCACAAPEDDDGEAPAACSVDADCVAGLRRRIAEGVDPRGDAFAMRERTLVEEPVPAGA